MQIFNSPYKSTQSWASQGAIIEYGIGGATFEPIPLMVNGLSLNYAQQATPIFPLNTDGNGNATKEQVHKMLQAQLGIELQPKYLDATDALAVAYTHWRITNNPYADIRAQLKPSKRKTSKKVSWADFLTQNPDRKL